MVRVDLGRQQVRQKKLGWVPRLWTASGQFFPGMLSLGTQQRLLLVRFFSLFVLCPNSIFDFDFDYFSSLIPDSNVTVPVSIRRASVTRPFGRALVFVPTRARRRCETTL